MEPFLGKNKKDEVLDRDPQITVPVGCATPTLDRAVDVGSQFNRQVRSPFSMHTKKTKPPDERYCPCGLLATYV